jgi:preprotein translocase subunit SecG
MSALLALIHIVVCFALILIVLLQTGKGADMGAAFGGGGSQTLFGSTGAGSFLGKATTAAAIVFMLTSLSLAYVSTHRVGGSVMDRVQTPAPDPAPSAEPDPESAPPAETVPLAEETPAEEAPIGESATPEPASAVETPAPADTSDEAMPAEAADEIEPADASAAE